MSTTTEHIESMLAALTNPKEIHTSCGKKSYLNEDEARIAMRRLGATKGYRLYIYRCHGHYHLTKSSQEGNFR